MEVEGGLRSCGKVGDVNPESYSRRVTTIQRLRSRRDLWRELGRIYEGSGRISGSNFKTNLVDAIII